MGKQINYYMDYDSFLLLAAKAIELGCEVLKDDKNGIARGTSTDIITKDCIFYYFHVPGAGEFRTKDEFGRNRIQHGSNAGGNTLIETGFSFISYDKRTISRNRLYSITGYYDTDGSFIARPDSVTKVYEVLARYVKKIASRTEIVEFVTSIHDENYLQQTEYRHKEYVTKHCRNLLEMGFHLQG